MKKTALTTALLTAAIWTVPTLATADDAEDLFKKQCGKCHSMDEGKHGVGPSLAGIYGRQAGTTSYKRYKGLKDSDIVWDDASLDGWLADPKGFLGAKTTMAVKVKDAEDRATLIEYLKSH